MGADELVKPGMTKRQLEEIEARKGQPLDGPDPMGDFFKEMGVKLSPPPADDDSEGEKESEPSAKRRRPSSSPSSVENDDQISGEELRAMQKRLQERKMKAEDEV